MDEEPTPPSKPAKGPPARLLVSGTTKRPEIRGLHCRQKKPPPAAAAPVPKKVAPAASAAAGKPAAKGSQAPAAAEPIKYKFSSEDAEIRAAELVPAQIAADLADANWKIRLAAMDEFIAWIEGSVAETAECEVLFRFLSKKPGWNEKNFQVGGPPLTST